MFLPPKRLLFLERMMKQQKS